MGSFDKGISFDNITTLINMSRSARIVTILDCCYAGAANLKMAKKGDQNDEARIGNAAIERKSRKLSQGQGKYILSASQAAQEAYQLKGEGNSIFTYFLLQGLNGAGGQSVDNEGNVTPTSLGRYVFKAMMDLPEEKRPRQTPITKTEGAGDIVLASHPQYKQTTNEELLKLLVEGRVEEFNQKREVGTGKYLDLSNANLFRTNLSNARLENANLHRANLVQANLEGANLANATLYRAEMEGINLLRANLSNASLDRANLANANLYHANLQHASLASI
jgi:Pentapeptide repeats (8 copies)